MSDFSDRALVAGSLYGVRSFQVDSLGRLLGVSYPAVWKPGVNEATCHRSSDALSLAVRRLSFSLNGGGLTDPDPLPDAKPAKGHDVASLKCGCGFYAYHDEGHNPHHRQSNVLGIVRGEGVTTVGSRGFRCQRAELMALIDPNASDLHGAWKRWCRFWGRHDALAPAAFIAVGVVGLVGVIAAAVAVSPLWLLALAIVAPALTILPAAFSEAGFDEFLGRATSSPDLTLVRRNYPDVPVYASLAAAVRDFPLSTPPAPVPSDDDFWTRSAS